MLASHNLWQSQYLNPDLMPKLIHFPTHTVSRGQTQNYTRMKVCDGLHYGLPNIHAPPQLSAGGIVCPTICTGLGHVISSGQ